MSVGTRRNPSAFNCNRKWRDALPMHFLRLANHLQRHWDPWKCAALQDVAYPCIDSFRWRTLWAFIVNSDSIRNKNYLFYWEGVFNCIILRSLQVKYYIVKVFTLRCNSWNKPTKHSFLDIPLYENVLMCRPHSWNLSKHFRHILYNNHRSVNG